VAQIITAAHRDCSLLHVRPTNEPLSHNKTRSSDLHVCVYYMCKLLTCSQQICIVAASTWMQQLTESSLVWPTSQGQGSNVKIKRIVNQGSTNCNRCSQTLVILHA